MRHIVLAITTEMTVSFATAVLTAGLPTPSFAAVKANRVNQVKDPRSYGECLTLATQRGRLVRRPRQQCLVATASLKG